MRGKGRGSTGPQGRGSEGREEGVRVLKEEGVRGKGRGSTCLLGMVCAQLSKELASVGVAACSNAARSACSREATSCSASFARHSRSVLPTCRSTSSRLRALSISSSTCSRDVRPSHSPSTWSFSASTPASVARKSTTSLCNAITAERDRSVSDAVAFRMSTAWSS